MRSFLLSGTMLIGSASFCWNVAADPVLPQRFQKPLEEAREQVRRDNEGPLGIEARSNCGLAVGILNGQHMRTRRNVVDAGYDEGTADKFVQCVVDFMYPVVGNE